MGSWARSHPELTIATGPRHHVANYRIANPASSTKLLELVGKVVREAIGLFPDETFFLGGDETACPYNECDYFSAANQSARCPRAYANTPPAKRAGFRCPLSGWMDNDGVRKWSGTFKPPGGQNVSDGHAQIFQWFAEQVEEFVTSAGRTPSWWNDRYDVQTDRTDHALPPASRPIVENWLRHGDQGLTPYLRDGWRVIQGAGWYLPSGPRQQVPNEPDVQDWSYCASPPGVWAEFYAEDPTRNASGASAEQMANLLGGEVSAWGNCIDASDLETKAWPASSAVAERLWSPSRANNLTEAFPRLAAFRCHMVRRGVRAESIHPGSCWSWPATPSIGHRPAPLTSDVKGAQ
jgi:N-acetyl-beta-hexosaminidase